MEANRLNSKGHRHQTTPDFIEHQLAHAVCDLNGRACNRTAHLAERRKMIQTWADYLDGLKAGAKMIPLQGRVVRNKAVSSCPMTKKEAGRNWLINYQDYKSNSLYKQWLQPTRPGRMLDRA
jgi:hypothetical protein